MTFPRYLWEQVNEVDEMAEASFFKKIISLFTPGRFQGTEPSQAERLYYDILAASRQPVLFAEFDVEDSIDGRFDALCLHVSLVMRHLATGDENAKALSQGLFDALFSDMDLTLREMGVGDMGVGKRVKLMSEAYMGRLTSYDDALTSGDMAQLGVALRRNLYRQDDAHPHEAALAKRVQELAMRISAMPHTDFLQQKWTSAQFTL